MGRRRLFSGPAENGGGGVIRILSGTLKGNLIYFTKNPHLRPTADKVRRAIFDTIRDIVPGSLVLDLFAGTGALGIEAMSLGASEATFVEHERTQAKTLDRNLERLGLSGQAHVMVSDALGAVKKLSGQRKYFDLFFVDPPYADGLGIQTIEALSASAVARPGSVLIWEHGKREEAPPSIGRFVRFQTKHYGDTRVTYYRA